MNILIIVNSLEKGGRTKHIAEEYSALVGRGHKVSLISLCEIPTFVLENFPALKQALVIEKQGGAIDLRLILRLAKHIKHHNVEVVHCHCEASALYGGYAARLTRRKVAMTFHRSEPDYYRPSFKTKLYLLPVSQFFAISSERMNRMTETLGLAKSRVSVLHWGIEPRPEITPERSAQFKLEQKVEGRMILSLGHLGEIKGHDESIKAFAQIADTQKDITLVIGGDGSPQDYERLETLIEQHRLSNRVILKGQLSEVLNWISACDIFLQPSREEGFGLVFLEAGACGKPTIATHVGGIPDIIVHDETGLLVEPEQANQVAQALNALLNDQERCKRMGEQAKARILNHFLLSKSIDSLEQGLSALVR